MTAVPDIPVPDEFEPTHTTPSGGKVQLIATIGGCPVVRYASGVVSVRYGKLTPIPPPLPKVRDRFYTIDEDDDLVWCGDLADAWRYVDNPDATGYPVRVVQVCGDGTWHHVDRDGKRIER